MEKSSTIKAEVHWDHNRNGHTGMSFTFVDSLGRLWHFSGQLDPKHRDKLFTQEDRDVMNENLDEMVKRINIDTSKTST